MQKNVKSIFLVLALVTLLVTVGAVCAADDADSTIDTDNTVSESTISDTSDVIAPEVTKTSDNNVVNTKNEEKINIEKNKIVKKESQTIILNSNNFDEYVTLGRFNEKVNDGDTIDIQGKLDHERFALNINKPLNITSSNGEGYINFATSASGKMFKISKEGSGTNITGLKFVDTHVRIENTTNVHVNNISTFNGAVSGIGSFSVREGSENITITNSYFKTQTNAGISNVVFAAAYNCLFENNTIEGYGRNDESYGLIGNLLYLTTYNVQYANPKTNINITIRNNTIRSYDTQGYGTCYGLALEGTGHIIEDNLIDTSIALRNQYADSSYDFETNVGGIIFNNNTVTCSDYNTAPDSYGYSEISFPGIASNNTFNTTVTIKQAHVYNNEFKKEVTITNDTYFENNTANRILVTGANNTLNNNEVYSNDNYAVTVSGKNNTLSNNKLISVSGRGNYAIDNRTEFISLNNSDEISGIVYINADNFDDYFINETVMIGDEIYPQSKYFNFKENLIFDGDLIILDITNTNKAKNMVIRKSLNNSISISLKLIAHEEMDLFAVNSGLTLINSTVPYVDVRGENLTLINSTVLTATSTAGNSLVKNNTTVLKEYPKENTWILSDYQRIGNYIAPKKNNGILDSAIGNDATILVHKYDSNGLSRQYCPNGLFIDRKSTFDNIPNYGNIECDVSFVEGSQFSSVNNIRFDGKVYVNVSNIEFINCTFNKGIEVNNAYITINDSTFNGTINLNSANNLIFSNNEVNSEVPININNSARMLIENNTIVTSADNTISFNEESHSNTVKNNVLIASSLVGDDTVISYDDTVEGNTPSYNTNVIITLEETLFKNDISTIHITVNNIINDTPVTSGYVEVYLDGILQGVKTLVNGETSLDLNTEKSSLGTVPLKVWYYDGIKYANNNTSISAPIVKSNITISVNEFTAKMNEKATTDITFLNQKGNPTLDTNITITVGRTTYTIETTNGVASLNELVTTEWIDAGKMIVTFPETEIYNRNSTTININTSKDDITPTTNIEQENNKVTINMELLDSLNNNVTDGKITITTLDGTQLDSTRIRNGTYNKTVTLPEDYTENLIVNYTGSYYYNDFTQELELPYNRVNTITTITPPEIAVINAPLEIIATVTDTDGNNVNNGKVIFTIADEIIAEADVIEGTATTTMTFTQVETLTIKATYQKNQDYNTSSDEATISIQKPTTQLNIEEDTLTAGETATLTATLTDQIGNNINGGKVTFKVKCDKQFSSPL